MAEQIENNQANKKLAELSQAHAELSRTSGGLRSLLASISEKLSLGDDLPKKPSLFKYTILFGLAIFADAVDFVAVDLVGPLWLLAAMVSVFITIMIFVISWITNTRYNDASRYNREIVDYIEETRNNIAHATRVALRVARISRAVGRRIPRVARVTSRMSRTITRSLVKIRRVARRNPLTKILVSAGLNVVPILSFIPWMTVGIFLSYWDERTTYNNVQQYGEELAEEGETAVEALVSVDSSLDSVEKSIYETAA